MTNSAPSAESAPVVLGVDVGGTTIKARLLAGRDGFLGEWRVTTPRDDTAGLATIDAVAALVERARLIGRIDAVGVAVPGVVDDSNGVAVRSVNVGWTNVPVRDLIRERTGLPTGFGQDVRAGALAESLSGAGEGVAGGLAFVPVGTGLASAFVVDGEALVSGGWAGEIGQVVIQHGPHAGLRVEEVASAGGLARRLGAANALAVAERVRAGDPAALVAWSDTVDVLADTLSWIAAVAAPQMIVVGGGLAESGALLFDPLGRALDARLQHSRRPVLSPARHGDAAAIVGAGVLARRALEIS